MDSPGAVCDVSPPASSSNDGEFIDRPCDTSTTRADVRARKRRRKHETEQPLPPIASTPTKEVKNLLEELEAAEKTEGLDAGTTKMLLTAKRLMNQSSLRFFVFRYDEGVMRHLPARFGEDWNIKCGYEETRLDRWELVADMLALTLLHREIVMEYGEDYQLCWSKSGRIQRLDERLCEFMETVLKRARMKIMDEETGRLGLPKTVVIREWLRRGTWETLSHGKVVPQGDLAEQEGVEGGYPLRISSSSEKHVVEGDYRLRRLT